MYQRVILTHSHSQPPNFQHLHSTPSLTPPRRRQKPPYSFGVECLKCKKSLHNWVCDAKIKFINGMQRSLGRNTQICPHIRALVHLTMSLLDPQGATYALGWVRTY